MEIKGKILSIVFALLLCVSFALSIIDTNELPTTSEFNHDNIHTHIEKICEYGPHSIVNKEENKAVQDYIVSELESLGITNSDTTDAPAYMIQEYVTSPRRYQNFYLENVIVHIPANAEKTTGEAVMVMAHFDSVPTGQGAADDALACGTMLEAIRFYLDKMENGYKISNDLVFCFVNGEEYGLLGSEAFMNEFKGFNNLIGRINFAINLESRGTAGTQIMFETSAKNYNTVKLFGEVNNNLFTCSIATMIYDMMPNGTDFSNLKTHYQGVNMANIAQGENYHTQNDNPENIKESCLTQQAQIINNLINKLGSYDLNKLYEAEENAIFFSYLNIGDVIYSHAVSIVLAVIGILLIIVNIVLSVINKKNNLLKTIKSFLNIIIGLALTAGITFGCYYLFQLVAAASGSIDFHRIGQIFYSNTAITIGIAILALGITVLATHFGCKLFKTEARDVRRAFAYIHTFLGIVLTFAVPDASYLFIFSGILLMVNEITVSLKPELENCRFELLVEALYMPVVVPIIALAVSALGLGMSYIFGVIFALTIFGAGISITPVCGYFSINSLIRKDKSKTVSPAVGSVHIIGTALIIFLCVSLCKVNAQTNLGETQGTFQQMDDDALIYSTDGNEYFNYCVYDLDAYASLKKYCPEMKYDEYEYGYIGETGKLDLGISSLSSLDGNTVNLQKAHEDSMFYVSFMDATAGSFTIDDGITSKDYELSESGYGYVLIHDNCKVTINNGSANVFITEYIVDYPELIPENYDESENLHFNLWMQSYFEIK
ncbi:MAG: M28 family peptidase [Ruminiclostridium sp.]|nr:M28 family peptidase [Ruminiclostridium sp.]